MKTIMCLSMVWIGCLSANAQWWTKKIRGNGHVITKIRQVDDYDKINATGPFDIELVSGEEGKLTVVAEDNLLEHIITRVKNKTLIIGWAKNISVHPQKALLITVPFKDLKGLSLTGSVYVYSESAIVSPVFDIALTGSGEVELELKTGTLYSTIVGSGDITLTGNTGKLVCSLSGSGAFDGYELITDDAEVTLSGSGDIELYVSKAFKGTVSGSGSIQYGGNPKETSHRVAGSGEIVKLY